MVVVFKLEAVLEEAFEVIFEVELVFEVEGFFDVEVVLEGAFEVVFETEAVLVVELVLEEVFVDVVL